MKKFFITISILVVGLLLISTQVFAEGPPIYERSPRGYTITSPVSFSVSGVFDWEPLASSWNIRVTDIAHENFFSEECIISNSGIVEMELPLGEYQNVELMEYSDENCSVKEWQWTLEWSAGPIFEVIASPPLPEPPFVEISDSFVAGFLSYVQGVFGSGLTPFVTMIIGIPFAFWVIWKVIGLMPKK